MSWATLLHSANCGIIQSKKQLLLSQSEKIYGSRPVNHPMAGLSIGT